MPRHRTEKAKTLPPARFSERYRVLVHLGPGDDRVVNVGVLNTGMTSWMDTEITKLLGLRVPIVLGPFGGASSVELTAAVSNAGGLGSYGAFGYTGEQIRSTAAQLRERTERPFAFNLWLPYDGSAEVEPDAATFQRMLEPLLSYYDELRLERPTPPNEYLPPLEEQLEAVYDVRPAVLSFVYGVPAPDVVERCRALGIATVGTATTVEEAIALADGGVDAVVATGMEAAGHRVSFVRSAEDSLVGTFSLVPQVVDAVSGFGIPVIAAGGVADGRGVAAALTLGADAVQVGSAFLACEESAAAPGQREVMFSERGRRTVLTRAFTGRLARGIPNRFTDEAEEQQRESAPFPVQSRLAGPIRAEAKRRGDPELISLWAGQSTPLLYHRRAAELIDALVRETDELLT